MQMVKDSSRENLLVEEVRLNKQEKGEATQISKLFNKVDNLEFRMRKMSVADPRNRETKYKPQIVPPRR